MEGDRDVELRRRMASAHAEEAQRVIAEDGTGEAARSRASRSSAARWRSTRSTRRPARRSSGC
ncbi:MAG: hypothetical protein M5U28_43720 [Sandaracinaceae bacterium]|nr:hypothetical protein [Sandaracinaceae bacterium]